MVKIAISGGSSEVGREIIDALLSRNKHSIVLLSRKGLPHFETNSDLSWVQVDYNDIQQLTETLRGIDTVVCFITSHTDLGSVAQKNLIDASLRAGVRRFAPSEWVTSSCEYMDWNAGKIEVREYLEAINHEKKVLEYTLFQPGLFLNYFTHPYPSAKHVNTIHSQFDFQNRRALVPDGCDDAKITLTTVQDLANVVALAIEHRGEWPVNGGIKGHDITIAQLIQLMEDVRGGPINVEKLRIDDLKSGKVVSTWLPEITHASIPPDQAKNLSGMFIAGLTLGFSVGAFDVTDEWNRLLPDYQFVQPKQFLLEAWRDKA